MVVPGLQARGCADRAVDIANLAAFAADEVMVVVGDACFVAGHVPGRLNPADEAGGGQGAQDVVHRLTGDLGEVGADGSQDVLGDRVRLSVDCRIHREPGFGHAQTGLAYRCGERRGVGAGGGHDPIMPTFLD